MDAVRDDFYVEDEPVEDVKRAWKSGEPVLVLPSRFRHRIHRLVRMLRDQIAEELRHAADRVSSSHTKDHPPARPGPPGARRRISHR